MPIEVCQIICDDLLRAGSISGAMSGLHGPTCDASLICMGCYPVADLLLLEAVSIVALSSFSEQLSSLIPVIP